MTDTPSHPFSVLVSPRRTTGTDQSYIWTINEYGHPMVNSMNVYATFEEACNAAKAKLDTLIADWQRDQ